MDEINLVSAFEHGAGYHGACWVDVTEGGGYNVDRPIPEALDNFLREASERAARQGMVGSIGCAYMCIIDGAEPENSLAWHCDNADGGVRFHTAISTDGAKVNMAWLLPWSYDLVGQSVEATLDRAGYTQPDNGTVLVFTTEPHGVLPQPARPGEFTAAFFLTLHGNRLAADLYTTNCVLRDALAENHPHAILPTLEDSR